MTKAACFPYRTEVGGEDIWACPQVIRSALAIISVPREKRVKGEFMVMKVMSHLYMVFAPLNPTSDRHPYSGASDLCPTGPGPLSGSRCFLS